MSPRDDKVLHLSPFWSEHNPFACCVVIRFPRKKVGDTPQFTGLPKDVLNMMPVEKLKLKLDELMKMLESMRSALIADTAQVIVEVCVRRLQWSLI